MQITDRKSFSEMTVTELRAEYARMRDAGYYNAGRESWTHAMEMHLPEINPTPLDYVLAAYRATTECERCHGTGIYCWGGTINGKPVHRGACNRCEGKGIQCQDDYHRNRAYDRHAIRRAAGF